MARVSINIEDQGGEMALTVVYSPSGFDPRSHSHQHANLLIKHMDEIGRKLGHATIETVEKPKTGVSPAPVIALA